MSVYALYKLCILEDAFIVEPALIVAAALTIQQGFAPDWFRVSLRWRYINGSKQVYRADEWGMEIGV